MRIRKVSVLAVAAVAAGLSLTACNNNGTNGASSSSSSSSTGSSSSAGSQQDGTSATAATGGNAASASKNGSATGTGSRTAHAGGGSICRTANLSFSSSHGMAEGEFLINLTNTGAHSCTMHGFPGVDLKGRYGTVSAARSTLAAPHVTLRPGQETRFTLHYPPNNTGGSGVTFTSLVVTPPNETHSHTMSLGINVPADSNASPTITVDPVGAGK